MRSMHPHMPLFLKIAELYKVENVPALVRLHTKAPLTGTYSYRKYSPNHGTYRGEWVWLGPWQEMLKTIGASPDHVNVDLQKRRYVWRLPPMQPRYFPTLADAVIHSEKQFNPQLAKIIDRMTGKEVWPHAWSPPDSNEKDGQELI